MDPGLQGKRAIVTGGTLGIGKAIARELAAGERVQQADLLRVVRGEGRRAMAARASTCAGARGLASGAEAGKELEHGAVEGLGLIPVGEVTGGREQDELGVRDLI